MSPSPDKDRQDMSLSAEKERQPSKIIVEPLSSNMVLSNHALAGRHIELGVLVLGVLVFGVGFGFGLGFRSWSWHVIFFLFVTFDTQVVTFFLFVLASAFSASTRRQTPISS